MESPICERWDARISACSQGQSPLMRLIAEMRFRTLARLRKSFGPRNNALNMGLNSLRNGESRVPTLP